MVKKLLKRWYWFVIVLLAISTLLCYLAFLGMQQNYETLRRYTVQLEQGGNNTDLPSVDKQEETNTPTNTTKTLNFGEEAAFTNNGENYAKVTITSIERFDGDDFNTPKGKYFVKVNFKITNISSKNENFNAHMFALYDNTGMKAERISKDYFSENITPNHSAEGSAYFDVKNDGPFEINVADMVWRVNFK